MLKQMLLEIIIIKKTTFKVVSVQVLCETDVTRNNNKTFKVVSVPLLCEADVTRKTPLNIDNVHCLNNEIIIKYKLILSQA